MSASGVDWYTPANYQGGAGGNAYGGGGGGGAGAYLGGPAGASSSYGGVMGGVSGVMGGSSGFEDEPPLLEELGIDVPSILRKTRAILFLRLRSKHLDDLDMGGALITIFALGGIHLLMGKLHFGIVLGWSVIHSAALWFLVNQLAGQLTESAHSVDGRDLGLYSCCCIVGYCLVPLVLHAAVGLLIPRGPLPAVLAAVCTCWSAVTATYVLGRRSVALEELRSLLLFPCVLLFGAFALLTLY